MRLAVRIRAGDDIPETPNGTTELDGLRRVAFMTPFRFRQLARLAIAQSREFNRRRLGGR